MSKAFSYQDLRSGGEGATMCYPSPHGSWSDKNTPVQIGSKFQKANEMRPYFKTKLKLFYNNGNILGKKKIFWWKIMQFCMFHILLLLLKRKTILSLMKPKICKNWDKMWNYLNLFETKYSRVD